MTTFTFWQLTIVSSFLLFAGVVSSQWTEEQIYTLNLDETPLEMWRELITNKKSILVDFARSYAESLKLNESVKLSFLEYGKAHPEIQESISAISILSGLDEITLYTLNFMYDLTKLGCTSIVVRQTDNSIFHARNLDYDFKEEISKLLVIIYWTRGGEIVYKSESIAGFISLITVTKPHQYSISINYRFTDSIQNNIEALVNSHYYQGIYLPRIVVNTATTFEEAVSMLTDTNVSSPIYYIVSGLSGNQGVVIERDRTSAPHSYYLTDDTWFLVQTNVDREDTRFNDYRYKQTIRNIQEQGQENLNQQSMLDNILSQFPTKNRSTISSSTYAAIDGSFESVLYDSSIKTNQIKSH